MSKRDQTLSHDSFLRAIESSKDVGGFLMQQHFLNRDDQWLQSIIEEVSYIGFDPSSFVKMFMKKLISIYPSTYSDVLLKLIILGMERGNNVSKMFDTMGDKKQEYVSFVSSLGVKSKVGINDRAKTITLSRIIACFPWVSCSIIKHVRNPVVKAVEIDSQFFDEMCTSSFAGLIPSSGSNLVSIETKAEIISCYYFHQMCFSTKISPEFAKKSKEVKSSIIIKFINAARDGFYIHEETKVSLLTRYGILNEVDGKFSSSVRLSNLSQTLCRAHNEDLRNFH